MSKLFNLLRLNIFLENPKTITLKLGRETVSNIQKSK